MFGWVSVLEIRHVGKLGVCGEEVAIEVGLREKGIGIGDDKGLNNAGGTYHALGSCILSASE